MWWIMSLGDVVNPGDLNMSDVVRLIQHEEQLKQGKDGGDGQNADHVYLSIWCLMSVEFSFLRFRILDLHRKLRYFPCWFEIPVRQ